jgi:hypothetical protein
MIRVIEKAAKRVDRLWSTPFYSHKSYKNSLDLPLSIRYTVLISVILLAKRDFQLPPIGVP